MKKNISTSDKKWYRYAFYYGLTIGAVIGAFAYYTN